MTATGIEQIEHLSAEVRFRAYMKECYPDAKEEQTNHFRRVWFCAHLSCLNAIQDHYFGEPDQQKAHMKIDALEEEVAVEISKDIDSLLGRK